MFRASDAVFLCGLFICKVLRSFISIVMAGVLQGWQLMDVTHPGGPSQGSHRGLCEALKDSTSWETHS